MSLRLGRQHVELVAGPGRACAAHRSPSMIAARSDVDRLGAPQGEPAHDKNPAKQAAPATGPERHAVGVARSCPRSGAAAPRRAHDETQTGAELDGDGAAGCDCVAPSGASRIRRRRRRPGGSSVSCRQPCCRCVREEVEERHDQKARASTTDRQRDRRRCGASARESPPLGAELAPSAHEWVGGARAPATGEAACSRRRPQPR